MLLALLRRLRGPRHPGWVQVVRKKDADLLWRYGPDGGWRCHACGGPADVLAFRPAGTRPRNGFWCKSCLPVKWREDD